MNEKEKKIKEQRTFEATRNNLMGLAGKLGIILKMMGQPIYEQGISDYQDISDEIPTMEIFDSLGNAIEEPAGGIWAERQERVRFKPFEIGWHYDGLGQGFHFEIHYDDEEAVLSATYKGYEVYREISGDLLKYVPNPDWEQRVDKLFEQAKIMRDKRRIEEKEAKNTEIKTNKKSWLAKMKDNWGL